MQEITPILTFAGQALDAGMSMHEITQRLRQAIALKAMERNGNNRTRAARQLQIHRNSFMRILDELPPECKPPRGWHASPQRSLFRKTA